MKILWNSGLILTWNIWTNWGPGALTNRSSLFRKGSSAVKYKHLTKNPKSWISDCVILAMHSLQYWLPILTNNFTDLTDRKHAQIWIFIDQTRNINEAKCHEKNWHNFRFVKNIASSCNCFKYLETLQTEVFNFKFRELYPGNVGICECGLQKRYKSSIISNYEHKQ